MYRRLGGRVVAGTDSPNPMLAPGASLHDEMRLLVAAGLTPEEALAAATREAARLLGADSIGVIAAGSVADFVVLTADPLADIANTRRIERVVARGTSYDPNELKAGW
jgi:imidazolonepropionase-like amidohydrolase